MRIGYVLLRLPLNEGSKVRQFARDISDFIKRPNWRVNLSPAYRGGFKTSTLTLKFTLSGPGSVDSVVGKESVPLAKVMNERKLTSLVFSHGAKEEDIFELLNRLNSDDRTLDLNAFNRTGIELAFFREDLETRIIPAEKLTTPPLPPPIPVPIPSPAPIQAPKFVEKPVSIPIADFVSNGKKLGRQALRTSVAQARPEIEAWLPEAKQRIEDFLDEKKECGWSQELVARSTHIATLAEQLSKLQKMLGLKPSEYTVPRYQARSEDELRHLKRDHHWERKVIERPLANTFTDRDLFDVFSRCSAFKLRLQTNDLPEWKAEQLQEFKDLIEWLDYLLFKNGENLAQEYAQWGKLNDKAKKENLAVLQEHFKQFARYR